MKRRIDYRLEKFKKRYCNEDGTILHLLGLDVPVDTNIFSYLYHTAIYNVKEGEEPPIFADERIGTVTTTGIDQERKIILDRNFILHDNEMQRATLLHELGHYCLHYGNVSDRENNDLFFHFYNGTVVLDQCILMKQQIEAENPEMEEDVFNALQYELTLSNKKIKEFNMKHSSREDRLECWKGIWDTMGTIDADHAIGMIGTEAGVIVTPFEFEADLFAIANSSFTWYMKELKKLIMFASRNFKNSPEHQWYLRWYPDMLHNIYYWIGPELVEQTYKL